MGPTKPCRIYGFTATAYETLVKHHKLAIPQLEQSKTRECCVDQEELYDTYSPLC